LKLNREVVRADCALIHVDDELQRLLEDDVELPDLSDTTYDTLAQRFPHQVDTAFDALPESHGHQVDRQLHDCVSEDHFGIQNEQSASSPSEPTQQQLNKNFARTINLLEQNRQPHVQRAALQLMCQPDSSKIRYVCQSVCATGQQCKRNPGSCEFGTSTKVGTTKGKCGMQNSCCFKVIFSKERKNHGKQSGGDQFSVSEDPTILDHSLTCSALGASSKQLTKSMVYNSDVAKSMLTFCKTANAPGNICAAC
jgi:hypothetical protein